MPSPTCTLFLARHGQTDWNRVGRWQGTTDIPLSDAGRAQARELAEHLRDEGICRVYASHLSRASETAEIVAAKLGLGPPVLDQRLRERGYGCFEGLTRGECAERYPDAWVQYQADRRAVPPDAEPQPATVERITAAINEIANASLGGPPVLVISHGGILRSFVHAALGTLLSPLGNGAVLRVQFQDGRFADLVGVS